MADALVSLKSDAADRSRAGSVKSIECELDGCDDEQVRCCCILFSSSPRY